MTLTGGRKLPDDGHGATRMAIALMMHEKADGFFHDTCLVLNFRPKVPRYYSTEPLATSDHLPTLYESSTMGFRSHVSSRLRRPSRITLRPALTPSTSSRLRSRQFRMTHHGLKR
ncbi:hypothetical protein ACUN9V_18545 [Salinicola sp. V024]|uniref:hypothetical protein n=1 Tax=Salinicola sp. V024 TaxID=3459609 RepID=UPI00404399CE